MAIMQRFTITSMNYRTHYRTFSLSLAWFGAICNGLPYITIKFIKNVYYFFKKLKVLRDNQLQIIPNQANVQ